MKIRKSTDRLVECIQQSAFKEIEELLASTSSIPNTLHLTAIGNYALVLHKLGRTRDALEIARTACRVPVFNDFDCERMVRAIKSDIELYE
jgi:hypothetical protein